MGENIIVALEIMGYGMAGIFAAIIVIIAFVWLLQKADGTEKGNKDAQ